MHNKVQVLDCTLRDGGYVNNWDFGHSVITDTYRRLEQSGIDFIEVGFLDDRVEFDMNKSIMPSTACINKIYKNIKKKSAIPVAMIDYGTCSIDNIAEASETFIEGIRVIFKKEMINEALPFCKKIKDKGYKLFIQAISITSYSDIEMLEYIKEINKIKPYAFSIVDTYGLLNKDKLIKYFYLIDNNLESEIKIGYHAHNNFQLAFSNTINVLEINTNRDVIVDSAIYGMGKSAGNCATELIAMHMNNYYGKNYDVNQILEVLDTSLMSIYKRSYWGYKYNFYISALQNCHPGYVDFLLDKKTLSVKAINNILSSIPEEKKLLYDTSYIEKAYVDYQNYEIDDKLSLNILKENLIHNNILLIGPGKTIINHNSIIEQFCNKYNPKIISVNFITPIFKSDYIFISNAKRYSKLENILYEEENNAKIIITSNITPLEKKADFILNYDSLLYKDFSFNFDNSLILLLKALYKINIEEVYLAGFDGLSDDKENYYIKEYSFGNNKEFKINQNKNLQKALSDISKDIKINFITETLYKV